MTTEEIRTKLAQKITISDNDGINIYDAETWLIEQGDLYAAGFVGGVIEIYDSGLTDILYNDCQYIIKSFLEKKLKKEN